MPSKFSNYHVMVNGTHTMSCAHFGCANHAAFDDLPGFRAFDAGHDWEMVAREHAPVLTEVVSKTGQTLCAYELNRGRLARVLDVNDDRLRGASHIPGRFAAE